MILAGAWVALVAIFAGIGLVIGQNRHLHKRPIGPRQIALIFLGGIVTGAAAGAASQGLFYMLSSAAEIVAMGRVASWTVLGCGVGFGIGCFVPNLHRHRATIAGAVGGGFAAVCFILLVPAVGDTIGRLLSAAILGTAIGLMMVLVEAASRNAYLLVHWSKNETSSLTLGSSPILIGSSREAHVLLPENDDRAGIIARISLVGGAPQITEQDGTARALAKGEILTYGRVRVEVCGAGSEIDDTPSHTPEKPRSIPAKPQTTVRSKSKVKWYS
jgi:Ca-activated chloride channel family protein